MIDYLVIGSGLFGSVFARQMTDHGHQCLVLEKRNHIGGNVFTQNIEGINVHKYGSHIFHTNDREIWEYVNQFATFNNYRHKVFVKNKERIFSFPINLMTMYQLWGINTPEAAKNMLKELSHSIDCPKNLEEWAFSQVGTELYGLFIKGYTEKQWGRNPIDLPASIIKRIPIRTNLNDFYFDDTYQGIPIGGYTNMVKKILNGIEVKLGIDYLMHQQDFSGIARNIVFTGPIDQFFNYSFGALEYRSLKFDEILIDKKDFQGTSVVNYTESHIPYTRIIEHKHFEFGKQPKTVISKEYPLEWRKGIEPYYPVNDERNMKLLSQYKELAKSQYPNVIFGGRLAEYRYYDMHQVIGSALKITQSLNEAK